MPVGRTNRRAFIAGLGTIGLIAPAAFADEMKTVGILLGGKPDDPVWQSFLATFVGQLRLSGWIEGRNVRFEQRWAAGDVTALRRGAQELEALGPAAILAATAPSVLVLKNQTHSIPIVFVLVIDAIALGLVNNLAKPGGNITGVTNFEPNMGSKWLELLKEIAPTIHRVGCLFNPELDAGFAGVLIDAIQSNAASLGVETARAPVRNVSDINQVMESFGDRGGVIALPSSFNAVNRTGIAAAAIQYHVPTISPFHVFPAAGGLMSYGSDPEDEFRTAALYMNRILKGERPADLPVQTPTKFKLVINLKTAKALGLSIPPQLLARADEVIE